MDWRDISDGMPVYSIQGGPLDAEDHEPVLLATDLGKVFLVVPEQESPGVVRYQIYLAGWWLEPSEGKPVKWARVPVLAGLSAQGTAGNPARSPTTGRKSREK